MCKRARTVQDRVLVSYRVCFQKTDPTPVLEHIQNTPGRATQERGARWLGPGVPWDILPAF